VIHDCVLIAQPKLCLTNTPAVQNTVPALSNRIFTGHFISMKTTALLLFCAALPCAALASGSYTARPPRPPTQKDSAPALDDAKYALGKSIFTGKAKLKAEADPPMAQQEAKLKELAGKLPKSVKEAQKLPDLAGKLNTKELEALEYFLTHRYKLN
jgi:hypothetical protein